MRIQFTIQACILAAFTLAHAETAGRFIVKDGQPNAEIVVAEQPPRLVKLAAEELRDYVRKISGVELAITNRPGDVVPIQIYVGRSAYTDTLGVTDEGLKHGAFRMVSGPGWLALVGHDVDFEPVEPYAHSSGDRERAQKEWEALTGSSWRNPMDSVYRSRHSASGIWADDEGGSLQAVYEFLRRQGVRWYMPGELGEIVPARASIALPDLNETVMPDFAVRDLRLGNVPGFPWEDFAWYLRLGLNNESLGGAHGMRMITSGAAMKEAHPEYYALYGGQRDTEFRGSGHACFSSQGLRREAIGFARAVFDRCDTWAVSVMPQDGYRQCGCALCAGKTPSALVWTFVNDVAAEVYKTHPDRLIVCGAYTAYQTPPDSIVRFSPNVVARISWVRPGLDDPARWNEYWDVVQRWVPKLTPGHLARNANVHWTSSPGFPVIYPRSIARELRAMKGLSLGENSSVPRTPQQRWLLPGVSHLNMYVLSRYLWDADQDLDALLAEYYASFYGPAAGAMRAAFDFAEIVFTRERRPSPDQVPIENRIALVERIQTARAMAGDSVYGRRIQLILDELRPLEELKQALKEREAAGDPRADAPVALLGEPAANRPAPVYRLRDIKTGEAVDIATTFQVMWQDGAIVFDVRCDEPDIEHMPVTTDVWGGDSVAILLETPFHSYYHIEVNPDGAVYDADWARGRSRNMADWDSGAEVKAERGADFWRIVVRIPVVPEIEGKDDPLHFVVGGKPTADAPWFFNIGRSRGLNAQRQVVAFSPTGATYHVPLRFARLIAED